MIAIPQYLLFTEVCKLKQRGAACWRFILEQINGEDRFEASDVENGIGGERLQLLSLVRGLEAIDEPAQVTVVTSSQYVSRGLKSSLEQWRQNEWKWERFGEMQPIRDDDLWKRIHRASAVHQVDCRYWKMQNPINAGEQQAPIHQDLFNRRLVSKTGSSTMLNGKAWRPGAGSLARLFSLGTSRIIQIWHACRQLKFQSPIYRVSTESH